MVAINFVDGYEDDFIVNHKDGDKENNHFNNLEWVSRSDNQIHSYNKLNNKSFGKASPAFTGSVTAFDVKTDEMVAVMRGNKQMKEMGFDYRLVSAVLHGKRKTHNGCYFIKDNDTLVKTNSGDITPSYTGKVKVYDVYGKFIRENTLKELEEQGYTVQRIIDCIEGRAYKHKNKLFKL